MECHREAVPLDAQKRYQGDEWGDIFKPCNRPFYAGTMMVIGDP